MTSLIFGTIYLGHSAFVGHRREKQRVKNYERWEGLRDEYDEQRKIGRETRSLDIQRTGVDYAQNVDQYRPVLTLRDQQEANDARTSWRPQESFDPPAARRTSVEITAGSGLKPIQPNKTGYTWDDGLPQPLKVSRRNWDDYQAPVSRSSSLRHASTPTLPNEAPSSTRGSKNNSPSPQPNVPAATVQQTHPHANRSVTAPIPAPQHEDVEPLQHSTPGGRMAELLGEWGQPQPALQPQQQQHRPAPYNGYQHAQTYNGYAQQPFVPSQPQPAHAPATVPSDGSMQEWWNRP
jgi:hypothetical protein